MQVQPAELPSLGDPVTYASIVGVIVGAAAVVFLAEALPAVGFRLVKKLQRRTLESMYYQGDITRDQYDQRKLKAALMKKHGHKLRKK